MDTYIGLDAHASSCTLGVLGPGGRRLGLHVVETNAKALIEVLRSIPGPRHLCLEEGTLASWLYEVLSPHVEEIVVTAVSESCGPKSDKVDAFGVAERWRIGAIKRAVYKERGQFAALGHRAKAHWLLVGDSVRDPVPRRTCPPASPPPHVAEPCARSHPCSTAPAVRAI